MIEVNEDNFEDEVRDGIVLVDFYAPWCGPCRTLGNTLKGVTGAKVVKVNVEDSKNLANTFKVTSIPKLVYMVDGEVKDMTVGLASLDEIQRKIDSL